MRGQWKTGWRVMALLAGAAAFAAADTATATTRPTMPPPGAVNYIEGQVSVNGQEVSASALRNVVLAPNQVIDTGQGYAEVLLTPGAFLRLGHNSEVRFESAGLADTRLDVIRGSAMIEAEQFVKGSHLDVKVDGATAQIEQKGLYDFDANQQAVKVLDGKVKLSDLDRNTILKKGNEVLLADVTANKLQKQSFDTRAAETDPLYVWSKVRSEQEAAANVNAANFVAVNGGWYGPGWYWDPYWNFYSFVPGWGFAYSPFGWGFYSPAVVYAAPYWHHGYYVRVHPGVYHVGLYHGGVYHGGLSGFHAAGGFHAGVGGFHGGAGFPGGGRR